VPVAATRHDELRLTSLDFLVWRRDRGRSQTFLQISGRVIQHLGATRGNHAIGNFRNQVAGLFAFACRSRSHTNRILAQRSTLNDQLSTSVPGREAEMSGPATP
jgi:hypothetical protein